MQKTKLPFSVIILLHKICFCHWSVFLLHFCTILLHFSHLYFYPGLEVEQPQLIINYWKKPLEMSRNKDGKWSRQMKRCVSATDRLKTLTDDICLVSKFDVLELEKLENCSSSNWQIDGVQLCCSAAVLLGLWFTFCGPAELFCTAAHIQYWSWSTDTCVKVISSKSTEYTCKMKMKWSKNTWRIDKVFVLYVTHHLCRCSPCPQPTCHMLTADRMKRVVWSPGSPLGPGPPVNMPLIRMWTQWRWRQESGGRF